MKDITGNTKFFLVVLLQVFILLGIANYYKNRTQGLKCFLKIGPVDPTSPLRGDYLSLDYPDISRIETSKFDFSPSAGSIVYVPLEQSGKAWRIKSGAKISKTMPVKGIFIKGIVKSGIDAMHVLKYIEVTYGIESYYIPQGSGRDINWGKDDFAEISLDKTGNPVLVKVYINNEPFPHQHYD